MQQAGDVRVVVRVEHDAVQSRGLYIVDDTVRLMESGSGLLDGLFSSARRALTEESYLSNRRAAGTATTLTDDLVQRSNLSGATATRATAGGAGAQRTDAEVACPAEIAGGDLESLAAGGYRRRLCELEHGTMRAVLATGAGGSEARDKHEKILHREIKVGSLNLYFFP